MKLIFPVKLYQKLRHYVEGTDLEITGMGKIRKEVTEDGDTDFYVEDIKIFKQKVSSANTHLDGVAVGKFFNEILKKGEKMSDWKLTWHSHNTMGAFFSYTDQQTVESWDLEQEDHNWMISLVTNHKGENIVRVDLFAPFRHTFNDITFEVDFGDKEMKEEIIKEIKEKVFDDDPLSWHNLKETGKEIVDGFKSMISFEEEGEETK